MTIASPSAATNERTAMIREAFRLEYITLAWMTVEATVATCIFWRGANYRSPTRSAAAQCGQTPSRASPAVGSPSWSWLRSWCSSSPALGGWTLWLHSRLSGSSSEKAARPGQVKSAATTANDI
jgi:hypothetical protein